MKLTLGYSPCPNDTFIFDAMVHHKVDTEGLEFEVQLHDVEALNVIAFDNKVDVTKLSYNAFLHLHKNTPYSVQVLLWAKNVVLCDC